MIKLKEDYTPHPFRWWHIPLLILLVAGTIYIAREYRQGQTIRSTAEQIGQPWPSETVRQIEGGVFGTFYHITYQSINDLQPGIDSTLQAIDNSLSPFNPNSVITAINNGTSNHADKHLSYIVELALKVSEHTSGAFDITVAPLVNAWGFGFKNQSDITETLIDSLLQFVGYDKISFNTDSSTITKSDTRLMLDASAIAKGYGVDAVADFLASQGVENYMVEIGGEIRLKGCNPQGKIWHIGISKPAPDASITQQTQNDLQEIIEITDIAVATSGNYRNFYEKDGKRYAHTINPRTGYPAQSDILSATVLASDCATADAYATAFMVMGMDKAKELLSQPDNTLKAYLIYTSENGDNAMWTNVR